MENLQNTKFLEQANFKLNYGKLASTYGYIDELGRPKTYAFVWISIISFILMIVMLIITKEKIDPATNKPIEKTKTDNILGYIKIASIVIFVLSLCLNGYIYYFVYLTQRLSWYSSLPSAAKVQIDKINTISSVIAAQQEAQQNMLRNQQAMARMQPQQSGLTMNFGNGLGINLR